MADETPLVRHSVGDGGRQKNRGIFDFLNSRNMLSARCLQKKAETSIYKNAEIGKAVARQRGRTIGRVAQIIIYLTKFEHERNRPGL